MKRFPPGISEEERPDLQDQLTRLIVRVLTKHSDLHYYQGYHDVAITFLLVVGEQLGFHIVEKLSSKQLRDFMAPTMEKTTFLLHFMYPIVSAAFSRKKYVSFDNVVNICSLKRRVQNCTISWMKAKSARYLLCRG